MDFITIIRENFWNYDFIILILAVFNGIQFWLLRCETDKLYRFYNSYDHVTRLQEEAKKQLDRITKKEKSLSASQLLDLRERMNKDYSLFSNLTTMFPLLGMLGTVLALLKMVGNVSSGDTSNFFAALTSTFWGIVFALIFKVVDATIAYKIEDNEKHSEHLLFPKEQ